MNTNKRSKLSIIRFIYLYLITAITFIVFIIGAVNIVDQSLKSFVFNVEEYDYARPVMPAIECERYLETDNKEAYRECLDKHESTEDEKEKSRFTNEAKRRISIGIAQVLVAFPLWIFHWRTIERDRRERKTKK
jgi:hypothetical protein